MLTRQRKQLILEKLSSEGQVLSKTLSLEFGVSEDTIRRDLRELAADGRLQRVHGGALPASQAVSSFAERSSLGIEAKKRVAKRGTELISPGQVVIIDGGTTTTELVRCLPGDLAFTAVTVGAAAIEGIAQIHADLFFMGVTGIHPDAGLTTGDYEEACIKRAFSGRAAETVVLASPEKINTASSFMIGELSLINTVVVEPDTDSRWIEAVSRQGISVVTA